MIDWVRNNAALSSLPIALVVGVVYMAVSGAARWEGSTFPLVLGIWIAIKIFLPRKKTDNEPTEGVAGPPERAARV